MKNQLNLRNSAHSNSFSRMGAALFAILTAYITMLQPTLSAAPAPGHGIVAANLNVVINNFDNDTNAVTLTAPYRIGDFRVPYGNNGDYDVQIGTDRTDDVLGGILITSVRENGRDDGHLIHIGTNLATSHIDYHRPGSTNADGTLIENSYWIPVTTTRPNSTGTTVDEYDINVAAAWFPYDRWIAGFGRSSVEGSAGNGAPHDLFSGSTNLILGIHYVDLGGGKAKVDLTSLGIDARTDGVLLVVGAKNEDNYGLSQVNAANGTWNLFSKDNGTDAGGTEQDPFAFVFVPKSDTNVVCGRFLGNGTITLHSGNSAPFTITPMGVGTWELKIPGVSPRFGVLLLSPEGGLPGNQDNIVTYQINDAKDGWIIQSWDLPSAVNPDPLSNPPYYAPLPETPGDGTEPVADFVFIPGAAPGITVSPTKNLYSTEAGGTTQFTVVLDIQPTADVTINVASENTAEGVASASSLTFTPSDWNMAQIVTVTGQDDAAEDGPVTYHVVLSAATSADADYNGRDPIDPIIINLDNEAPFTIVPSAGLETTEGGQTATFDVVLNSAPTSDVVISLSSSDTTEGTVSPSSLTFTTVNWNQVRTVTVTGADDPSVDGNIAYTIVTAPAVSSDANFNGKNPPDVGVVNLDNDSVGLNISADVSGLSVVEGHMVAYTVSLNSQPSGNVTVGITSSDTVQGGSVSTSTLTFTPSNWNTNQIVTVTGVDDLAKDGSTSWFITNAVSSSDAAYGALSPAIILMTTVDNEPGLTLASSSIFYTAGGGPIGIGGGSIISDANAENYNGVILTIASTAGGTADDRIQIRNVGTGAGQIGVSVGNVTYGGTTIGSFSGGVGTSPLVVTFNGAATPAAAQALLRNIIFSNTNGSAPPGTRTVMVTLRHVDTGAATAALDVRVGPFHFADFQEGADYGNGLYTGEADIELFEDLADLPQPAGHSGTTNDPRMWLDGRTQFTTEEAQVLMRFDNIIGAGPGQIPQGATVVSAELLLTVVDTGHGSPMFRMLVPWNEQSETWQSFGDGIQIDNVEATNTYASQFGVQTVAGTSETGQITVGVTPDVQAWVNGQSNYGWGMVSWDADLNPAWSRGNNGLAFRPSEAPIVSERPRLRVIWVPAGTPAASFRQNVGGYISARDTRIREDSPTAQANTLANIFVDFAGSHDIALMRFDEIIGTNPGQVPPGSQINAAFLDLASLPANAPGDGGQFFAMLTPWVDTDTWNSLGGGIQPNGVQAAAQPTAIAGSPDLKPNVFSGYLSFDVTPDVQSWASGSRPNYGWAIIPWDGGSDGWAIGTAENSDEGARPRLRVYFTAGAPAIRIQSITRSATTVTINFTGVAGDTYNILRSGTVTGTYTSVGTAVVAGDGTATFLDNPSPNDAAFYRISHP